MKKKKRTLALVTQAMEDAKLQISKNIALIKPDIDMIINSIKPFKDQYPKPFPLISNTTASYYEPRLTSVTNTIYLDNDGDLYKKNKAKYCYSMHTAKIRLEIIKYLMDHADYSNAEDIREYTTSTSIKAVREAIRSINSNVSRHLKINQFIESRQGSGYRINPKYEIIIE